MLFRAERVGFLLWATFHVRDLNVLLTTLAPRWEPALSGARPPVRVAEEPITVLPELEPRAVSVLLAGLRFTFTPDEARLLREGLCRAIDRLRGAAETGAPVDLLLPPPATTAEHFVLLERALAIACRPTAPPQADGPAPSPPRKLALGRN